MLKWELLKFECQKFSIQFGKQQSKDQSKTYADNVSELNEILNIPVPSDEDKLRLHSLREKYDLFSKQRQRERS